MKKRKGGNWLTPDLLIQHRVTSLRLGNRTSVPVSVKQPIEYIKTYLVDSFWADSLATPKHKKNITVCKLHRVYRYTYMCQLIMPALVQILVCRLFGAKPLLEPVLAYCYLDTYEYIAVKFKWKSGIFIYEYVVCTMATILPRSRCAW